MSIYVYITRRSSPDDESGDAISRTEWHGVVADAIDFRVPFRSELALAPWSGGLDADARVWTGHPGVSAWPFEWRDGQIEVKNPDDATLARMRAVALQLGARVQSEAGEVFDQAD